MKCHFPCTLESYWLICVLCRVLQTINKTEFKTLTKLRIKLTTVTNFKWIPVLEIFSAKFCKKVSFCWNKIKLKSKFEINFIILKLTFNTDDLNFFKCQLIFSFFFSYLNQSFVENGAWFVVNFCIILVYLYIEYLCVEEIWAFYFSFYE